MDLMSLRVTQNAYFSLFIHTKQLLLMTFCDPTAGIVKWGRSDDDGHCKDGQTLKVEIVM